MDVLHVAVDVTDIETASGFYEDALGLRFTRAFTVEGTHNYCVGGEGPAEIQFREVDDPVVPAGINHLSVGVDDLDATVETAVSGWDATLEREPFDIDDETRAAFVTDPEGYTVELIEQ
ncbi:VOC family protein [Halarchaeum nitratireducens]|uniref:VOC domain-containing protein n=1 Tax=Halarchaeum nitratireducens TaxID=489913 RepID=A0A830G8W6_9EURY|nr:MULTISPECIES: VOC family protein [Halarchaeum]MBP2250000.1 lactoylglutathione lyase [Halarchaeum solikamskense]GGN09208.1 hypothetical protein GCM10009021_05840 [Halarchaeum nitratireducens]